MWVPEFTATDDELEPWRIDRLGKYFENLRAESAGAAHEVVALHDHKGTLEVFWYRTPSTHFAESVENAWRELGEVAIAHRPPPEQPTRKGILVSKEINIKSAEAWAHSSYQESAEEGYYTQAHFAQLPAAAIFHQGAKRLGLVEPFARSNRWIQDHPPTDAQCQRLLDYYQEHTGQTKAKADIVAVDPQFLRINERLQRVEEKLDALLKLWA